MRPAALDVGKLKDLMYDGVVVTASYDRVVGEYRITMRADGVYAHASALTMEDAITSAMTAWELL